MKVIQGSVQMSDTSMTIGVFARRSRLSPKALRLYESNGILVPARVDEFSGYRRYDEQQLRDARTVRMLRRLDMPLNQVARLMSAPRDRRGELLEQYWSAVEVRIARQRSLAAHALATLSEGKESYPMYEISIRDVPEQTVLTEQRHLLAPELPHWIGAALDRQQSAASATGGAIAAPFVAYHGEVSEDSDGPVEACTPIDPVRAGEVDAPVRVEPGHREAFTRIVKAQVVFPDILSAYDAVESWIAQNGERVVGSPREVYFADFDSAGPDDEVVDIAFVIADH